MVVKINLKVLLYKSEYRSMVELSEVTGISYITLMKLANNQTKTIDKDVLLKLCKTFNCGVSDLITIEDGQAS